MKKLYCALFISLLLCGGAPRGSDGPPAYDKLAISVSPSKADFALSPVPADPKGSISQEAGLFTALFSREYGGAYITKVRWQLVDDESGNSTYIIEGIENGSKYILKLLNWNSSAQKIEDIMILGRVERPLNDNELRDDKPAEKPLELANYISVQQILDTALGEFDSTVQEWKVVWVDEREVIQVILWGEDFAQKILVLDAKSGEILRKMPQ